MMDRHTGDAQREAPPKTGAGPRFVAVTDSPAGADLSIEREVLAGLPCGCRVEKVAAAPEDALIEGVRDADGILCMHAHLNRRVIEALRRCQVIARFGTGLDSIDTEAAQGAGIAVYGVHDYCTQEVADHTLALLLAWNRKLLPYHRFVVDGTWNERTSTTGNWGCGPVSRLAGQTLGLLGFGHIGRAVAARAGVFGLRVLAWSRSAQLSVGSTAGAAAVPTPSGRSSTPSVATALPTGQDGTGVTFVSFLDVLREADFVSLHLPLTPETRGLMDRAAFAMMKPGAVLINTARGGLVDEAALVEALRSGRLGGALLDVYTTAPLPLDGVGAELRRFDNVILTPHVAFYSEEALRDLRRRAAEAVLAMLAEEERE